MIIAGHSFDSNDRCEATVTEYDQGVTVKRVCNKKWLDICHCDETCVGKEFYSHRGSLTWDELEEIKREKERRASLYEDATRSVSSGSLPVKSSGELVYQNNTDNDTVN